jgi:hypothetical protein
VVDGTQEHQGSKALTDLFWLGHRLHAGVGR